MPSVNLDDQEWQWLINMIGAKKCGCGAAFVTWADANPLLMKIGSQLQRQAAETPTGIRPSGNSHAQPDAQ